MEDLLSLHDFLFFLVLCVPTLAVGALLVTAPQWIEWLLKRFDAWVHKKAAQEEYDLDDDLHP